MLPKTEDRAEPSYGNPARLYAKVLSDAIEQSISSYSQKHPYIQKSPYTDKKDSKKSSYGDK
jgi:hypothetical protein